MSRWIEADRLHKDISESFQKTSKIKSVLIRIDTSPSIDIVRCGECRHFMGDKYCYRVLSGDAELYKRAIIFPVEANDYCSYGERRE